MREVNNTGSRLLGFVQLRVGDRVVAVPVQSLNLAQDGWNRPGGFYVEGQDLGIYVDVHANAEEVAEQIRAASNDAAQHIARKYSN
jgi:hypothetical protein